mmetsp:Transcript_40956/g.131726  ORF Transcript_40956/g.131726 Transcript_40956/m.131726 type:complete len:290 (+) Transcript_40956:196-1065(+)
MARAATPTSLNTMSIVCLWLISFMCCSPATVRCTCRLRPPTLSSADGSAATSFHRLTIASGQTVSASEPTDTSGHATSGAPAACGVSAWNPTAASACPSASAASPGGSGSGEEREPPPAGAAPRSTPQRKRVEDRSRIGFGMAAAAGPWKRSMPSASERTIMSAVARLSVAACAAPRPATQRQSRLVAPLLAASTATPYRSRAPKLKPYSANGASPAAARISSASLPTRPSRSPARSSSSRPVSTGRAQEGSGSSLRNPWPGRSHSRTSSHAGADRIHGSSDIATSATP